MTNKFADFIFHHGVIYTADSENSIHEAIAVKDGVIIAVGSNESIQQHTSNLTQQTDLQGKMLLPGLIDAHIHPFWGGQQLVSCSLNYRALTLQETLSYIQRQLSESPLNGENDWFQVRAWTRSSMIPSGADVTRADLDSLNTRRPVILFSNDCHTLAANSRALELFALDKNAPEPSDGKIGRTCDGELNGILEDAPAMRAYDSIPSLSHEQNLAMVELVQKELNKQGITTVFDARVASLQLDLYLELKAQNKLYIRYLGAKEITPDDSPQAKDAEKAVKNALAFITRYPHKTWTPEPDVGVASVKFFVDGVIQPPTMTASLLQPYRENKGTDKAPDWQATERYGDLYFSNDVLEALIVESGKAGLDPHVHTVGDGAIEVVLNSIKKMRNIVADKDIRPALAHNELVAAHQYKRFADLGVMAALSYQWAAIPTALIEDEYYMLGEERFQHLEPAGRFIDAGVKIVYGSDWPIDALNTWYNFQVAMTRQGQGTPDAPASRLHNDRNLTVTEVIRSATIDAAYLTRMEKQVGSLEVGKFADLIVLDNNLFETEMQPIEQTKVLLTMVGGKIVYKHNEK